MLVVFHVTIHYDADEPDTPANKLFIFRMLDTNGTDYLGAIVPYVYYNSGYDQGCSAFYFSAEDAPAWEQPYIIRIYGNPEYFASSPSNDYTLVTSDYSQLTTTEENQALLGEYVLDIARELEINWDTTLLTVGDQTTILNMTGETYFRGAIQGLQAMCPQIFAVQVATPQYDETEWTQAQGTAYQERFADNWVGQSLENVGDALHMDWNIITGIGMVALVVVFSIISYRYYGTTKPAMISGVCVLLGGTVLGFVAPAVMGITVILCALYLGYHWFFKHG